MTNAALDKTVRSALRHYQQCFLRTPALLLPAFPQRSTQPYLHLRWPIFVERAALLVLAVVRISWFSHEQQRLHRVALTRSLRRRPTTTICALLPYRERQQRVGHDPFAKPSRDARFLRIAVANGVGCERPLSAHCRHSQPPAVKLSIPLGVKVETATS